MKIIVIGGGAAGFFSAIQTKLAYPNFDVTILEKSNKLLAKVKISGGGRCNVTNDCSDNLLFSRAYPRGEKQLNKAFREFNKTHIFDFFESRGVKLTVQEDNCVFPVSQNSQTIIDCFMNESRKLGVKIQLQTTVKSIQKQSNKFLINTDKEILEADKIIVAIGGQPKLSNFSWLQDLGLNIIEPLPSLFTFNMPDEKITQLMGVVVNPAQVKIIGEKLSSNGPLLITHWGMSGPAILKLSAWGARTLADKNYQFSISVNWLNESNEEKIRSEWNKKLLELAERKIINNGMTTIPSRLWFFLLNKYAINLDKKWKELSKKEFNQLLNGCMNDIYKVGGKTTFKQEFVTAGGIDLKEVNFKTMESKIIEGLHFAGEILDIDGITGGYNFQSAWTTGFLAGRGVGMQLKEC